MRQIISLVLLVLLSITVTGCATKPPAQPAERLHAPELIVGMLWGWEETVTPEEIFSSPDPKRFSVRLMPDGKAQITLDCNKGVGSYSLDEGKLSFSPLASTKMACKVQDKPLDYHFGRQLQQINSFFLENGKLYLEMKMDSGTMRFKKIQP